VAARRLIVILLALLVVSSIAAALAPVRPSEDDQETTETTTPQPPPPGKLVRRTIDVGARKPATIALELGDELTLTVTSDRTAEIEIPGLGELDDADPDAPARFDLLPREPGGYEVRLLDSGRRLGTIEVAPRSEARDRKQPGNRSDGEAGDREQSDGRLDRNDSGDNASGGGS
jgi:hypothetical protein